MQHHDTKGFLYSVIEFEWSSYTQLSLLTHYSACVALFIRNTQSAFEET